MQAQTRYLNVLVFVAGMTTLGVELAASRLLEPWFGSSILVWASLIGLILLYLSVGYTLGGRLADRSPNLLTLCQLAAWAGFLIGWVPLLSRPVLSLAARGFDDVRFDLALLGGSLSGVLALLAVPVILLGCIAPFAVRLTVTHVDSTGQASGRIYALSTVGSILGVFLPVLVLIPQVGTRQTFSMLGIGLLAIACYGIWLCTHRARALFPYAGMLLIVLLIAWVARSAPIKPAPGLVFEAETPYNYVQVVHQDGEMRLLLNEGQGLQSVYAPDMALSEGIWDYFLIVPFFNSPPYSTEQVDSLCLIGLAGGTIAHLYTQVFGSIPIDGVELDPTVIEAGQRYFAMTQLNIRAVAQDGRFFLQTTDRRYDVIAVDAYRPPYIPFHLATVEFFELARAHLTDEGVIAVNVGRTHDDYRLVDALAATLSQVFPSVYIVDEPDLGYGLGNSLVVGTVQPTRLENLHVNAAALTHPLIIEVMRRALPQARVAKPLPDTPIFTDDRAPIEQVVHGIILRYLLSSDAKQ
ncbi:MAG: fused MFS/spermidine synthase [Anaerolineae bacterium]|nr:fused MFS/spermidine synthase [Anaerolineae bacterium]MDW8100626.1 fused MFS/spermidine synthase [Anaerolineae bacterium]